MSLINLYVFIKWNVSFGSADALIMFKVTYYMKRCFHDNSVIHCISVHVFEHFIQKWDKGQAFLWLCLRYGALAFMISCVSWRENMWLFRNQLSQTFLLVGVAIFKNLCFKFYNLILGNRVNLKRSAEYGQLNIFNKSCNIRTNECFSDHVKLNKKTE